ncbi:uncharacterized protein [Palaemon carinicauda]|uniref:uncharacterized protein isoform X1 n=1 Tax=Palaemon carinicauda TaxID=392227 RepID=UPI0035B68FF7
MHVKIFISEINYPILISLFLSLQEEAKVKCAVMFCNHKSRDFCGHKMCRSHAPYSIATETLNYWDPKGCIICSALMTEGFGDPQTTESRDFARKTLRKWVRGVQKNSPGSYLPNEAMRSLLLPKAQSDTVVPQAQVKPPFIQLTIETDINKALEGMDIHQERMSEVSSDTEKDLLQENPEEEVVQPPEEEEGSISKIAEDPQFSVTAYQPVPSTSSAPTSQSDPLLTKGEALMAQLQLMMESMCKEQQEMRREDRGAQRSGAFGGSQKCVRVPDLPQCSETNPWRYVEYMPMMNGKLYISEKMGAKPLEDLQFWPNVLAYPECFVRLRDEPESRDEMEPKEVMIFEHEKAQALLTSTLKKAGYTNLKVSALSKRQPTFLAPSSRAFPFSAKALNCVLKAVDAGKPCPTLEECKPLSLALPTCEKEWNEVHLIFSISKLDPEIAGQQFNENLPKLSEHLLRREQETKERLAASLSLQNCMEMCAGLSSAPDMYTVLAKMHMATLVKDMYAFVKARRGCREHVFVNATVKHEPRKLIISCIWDKDLSPKEVVQEVVAKATPENRNLLQKWGMSSKRKSSSDAGPQPKNRKTKKPRMPHRPAQHPTVTMTTVPQMVAQLQTTFQMVPQQLVAQSPAFNPGFERHTTTFRAKGRGSRRGSSRNPSSGRGGRGQGNKSSGSSQQ